MANIEKIRDWIHALESDKFKQCQTELDENMESFCCIGVLGYINNMIHKDADGIESIETNSYELCKEITGIDEDIDKYWKMNDQKGMNFKEIAQELRMEFKIND